MRDVYWKHVREVRERLQKEEPNLTKTQALEKAREESMP